MIFAKPDPGGVFVTGTGATEGAADGAGKGVGIGLFSIGVGMGVGLGLGVGEGVAIGVAEGTITEPFTRLVGLDLVICLDARNAAAEMTDRAITMTIVASPFWRKRFMAEKFKSVDFALSL